MMWPPCRGVAGDGKTAPDDGHHRRSRLEAVLLVAREPLVSRKLAQLANLADGTEARTLVRQLNQVLVAERSAYQVEEVAGGFQLLTRPEYARWLRQVYRRPDESRLSAPALETLSVVAYRQPALRAEVEAIRGVQCGEMLRQLMERDMVRIVGRSEELGRPFLYGTTRRFLQVFGLRHLDELPRADVLRGEVAVAAAVGETTAEEALISRVDQKELDVNVASFVQSEEVQSEEVQSEEEPEKVIASSLLVADKKAEQDDEDEDEFEDEEDDDEEEEDDDDEYEDDDDEEEEFDEDEFEDDEDDEDDEEDEDEDEDIEDGEWEEVDDDDDDEEDDDDDDEDEEDDDDDGDDEDDLDDDEDGDDDEDDDLDDDDDDDEDEDEEDWDEDDYEDEDDDDEEDDEDKDEK